jgi:transcriptional regulator with XRE-family HTH domain
MTNIGYRIKEKRKEMKMSAEELGKRLGKDRSTIYRYEKGDIENLPLDILEPIAKALQTTPAYLMGWEQVQKKNDALTDIVVRLRTDEEFCSVVEGLNKLDTAQLASIKQIVETFLM